MRNASLTIWVMAVFVVAICFGLPKADATIYFDDGGQHTIDYAIHDDVHVDYGTPDAGTQVELVDTGSIDGYLKSYENSQVTVSGGKIGNSLWTFDNSQATVSGGEMFGLKFCDNSQVTVLGGEIGYSLWAYDNSEVTVSGGDILYWLGALENSEVTVSGGKIGYGVYAGCPPDWDTSILTFEGTDFAVNGNPLAYGDFASDYAVAGTDPGGNSCLTGTLTGTLADGGTLNKTFYIFDDADITFAMPEPAIIYVDADASGANNGSSWTDAYRYLQEGLAAAWSGDEIRVAQGIYKPDEDSAHPNGSGSRTATFRLKNGVPIKGGYAGFGEPDPNARDIETYKTILSGDLYGNDIDIANPEDLLDEPTRAENSYHVVTGSGCDETTVLDGFTITAGNADEVPPSPYTKGGGMYNTGKSNLTVSNCTFNRNSAMWGGGINNDCSNPTVTNCTFSQNSGNGTGGGLHNGRGDPILTNCTFIGNYACRGGGMYSFCHSNPTLNNCTFSGNSAEHYGGGMYNKSGVTQSLTNCLFSANSAGWYGGGMSNAHSNPTLTNCTFVANSARDGRALSCGSYEQAHPSNVELVNCIVWDGGNEILNRDNSTITITYSDVQGGWPGEGNIGEDPLFVDADGADNVVGTEDDNLRLLGGSPCIDAGDNTALPADSTDLDGDGDINEPVPFDLDGNPRIVNGIVDIGAFEAPLLDPVELLVRLPQKVIDLNLQHGIANSLDGKLEAALKMLEGANQNNDVAAINTLEAFVNAVEAQRGNKILEADADALIADVLEIIDLLTVE